MARLLHLAASKALSQSVKRGTHGLPNLVSCERRLVTGWKGLESSSRIDADLQGPLAGAQLSTMHSRPLQKRDAGASRALHTKLGFAYCFSRRTSVREPASQLLPTPTQQAHASATKTVQAQGFSCFGSLLGQPALYAFKSESKACTTSGASRRYSTTAGEDVEPREGMDYDVVIVGAGPAGLSAAIRLKQKCAEEGKDLSVCVVEKGAQVGAHILSGNVLEPRALDELLPNWRNEETPIKVSATKDRFYLLTEKRAIRMPSPFQNHGKFVTSLSEVTRWLGSKAEELGVEIYPGFAAAEVLYSEEGAVRGIATNDMGVAKDGSRKDSFQRGMELRGRVTLFGEGCRGSLSETLMKRFGLREKAKADPQSYALGIKEVWEVDPAKHEAGSTVHTVGWPLDRHTYGGSFIYHMADNQVAIGYVVALDYKNPYLSPYQEFQRFKLHPFVKPLLEGGTCVQYGARSLNEGGLQAIPELAFPGGALIGCSAGFLNVPKIKGTHTAMKSGMLAAEAAFSALASDETAGTSGGRDVMLTSYCDALKASWVWDELYLARNIRPAFHAGLWGGLAYSGLDHYVLRGRAPWTFHFRKPDYQHLEPASRHQPIEYPKPDNEITFDLLTSLYRSSTNHDHNQPAHLQLRDPAVPATVNHPVYAGPEGRYCPARVYEYVPDEKNQPQLHINAQNCLHCKACDIKDPTQNIRWTVPEGGGGPGYSVM